MMKILNMIVVGLSLPVLWGAEAIASVEKSSNIIECIETVYFSMVDGSDAVLSPETYGVEVAETWLRVMPQEGTQVDAILIEAEELTHQEILEGPKAKVTMADKGMAKLVLLLLGGKGLQAMGYTGGILSRAVPRGAGVPGLSKPILKSSPVQSQTSPKDPFPNFKGDLFGVRGLANWLRLEVQRLSKKVAQLQAQVDTPRD
jgi:hypothetical protein